MLEKASDILIKAAKEVGVPFATLLMFFVGTGLVGYYFGLPLFNVGIESIRNVSSEVGKQTPILIDMRATQSEEVIRSREAKVANEETNSLLRKQEMSQERTEALLKELVDKMQ